MTTPRHTPYDGSSRLFQIGLKPLSLADWIDVDERLPAYLREKDRLFRDRPTEVFAAEPGTDGAQREVLALLADHLPVRFPQIYRRDGAGRSRSRRWPQRRSARNASALARSSSCLASAFWSLDADRSSRSARTTTP